MPPPASAPTALIVMGVSGSGKSTIGEGLAVQLGWPYRDGDSFHPPANVEKMHAGIPLTDEDRWPWLDAIARWIDEHRARGEHAIVACSALKRVYRDRLRGGHADVRFIYLKGSKAEIGPRMAARLNHFMPPSLLDSQLATLEEPGPDENPVVVSIAGTPAEIEAAALARLGLATPVEAGRPA